MQPSIWYSIAKALAAGDYAVELDGNVVAAVERKSLADLVSTLSTGKGNYMFAAGLDAPTCPAHRHYSCRTDGLASTG